MKLPTRRPSPALVIACIALFVSLSGVSYGVATGFIDSREIKNNEIRSVDIRNNTIRSRDLRNNEVRGVDIRNSTIRGRDIAMNTITGADVREDTLEKVPSAAAADTATNATNAATAQSLPGVRVVPIKHRSGDVTNQTILSAGGLELTVSCAAGDEDLAARTSVPGGEIAVISNEADGPDEAPDFFFRGISDSFDPGETFAPESPIGADDRIYEVYYLGGDGTSVTAHLITDDDVGASDCIVSGYAVVV